LSPFRPSPGAPALGKGVLFDCASPSDDLGIGVIAEGVETELEYRWFKRAGVRLFQGYLFGRPEFESLSKPLFIG
jgi:EAL domain-containing protein (putative c-di-GMP-specific phosphodiesterase class I)